MKMKSLPPIKCMREQARCVQEEYPELFDYLAHRDRALEELFRELMHAVPHLDALPALSLPFIEAVVEAMAPGCHCPVCTEEEMLWLLSRPQRARLCQLCRHGFFLRRAGIGGLNLPPACSEGGGANSPI